MALLFKKEILIYVTRGNHRKLKMTKIQKNTVKNILVC